MKHQRKHTLFVAAALMAVIVGSSELPAQNPEQRFKSIDLSGPRLGVTIIPQNNDSYPIMKEEGISSLVSQFGWHFEWQVVPEGGGPSFVIEFVPLVGGVEYGKIIPSATLGLGIRLPDGFEFGLGPNLMLGPTKPTTALMFTVGKSFQYGGVNIPVNLVCVTNNNGQRYGIMIGYAITR